MSTMIPYDGDKPFIFISYSHRDNEQVWSIIDRMMKDGYRVWYDDGINPGTEWDEFIATKISSCKYFVAFISENYINSDNCKDELNYARDTVENRLLIYLEEVNLPKGMEMRLGRIQAIHKHNIHNEKAFYNKLYSSKNMNLFKEEPLKAPIPVPVAAPIPTPVSVPGSVPNVPVYTNTVPQKESENTFVLPSTKWGRWGIPGFRNKNALHMLAGGVTFILTLLVTCYLLAYGFYNLSAFSRKMYINAGYSFVSAAIILLLVLFNSNYGWVKQRLFKLHRLPRVSRWVFIISVNVLIIILWIIAVALVASYL